MKKILKFLISFCLTFCFCLSFVSCSKLETLKQLSCKHEFKLITTRESSCEKEGELIYSCSSCGKLKSESLPMTEHISEYVYREGSTCSKEGHESGYRCSLCNKVLSGLEKIPTCFHNKDDGGRCTLCTLDVFDFFRNENYYSEADINTTDYFFNRFIRVYRPTSSDIDCICGGCFGFHGLELFGLSPFIGAYQKDKSLISNDGTEYVGYDTFIYSPESFLLEDWTIKGDLFVRYYEDYVDFYIGAFEMTLKSDSSKSYTFSVGMNIDFSFSNGNVIKELILNDDIKKEYYGLS